MMGAVFTPVRSDVSGNVEKVRLRMREAPGEAGTLQSLVLGEKRWAGESGSVGCEGLRWLCRGLEYSLELLTLLYSELEAGEEGESLSSVFSSAYERTLKMRHNWAVRTLFGVMVRAAPTRSSLMAALRRCGGGDLSTKAEVAAALRVYLADFRLTLRTAHRFLQEQKLEDDAAQPTAYLF